VRCKACASSDLMHIIRAAGKWKGVTVAVKIVEHSAETEGELLQLRESLLSSSIVHPNVVSAYGSFRTEWTLHLPGSHSESFLTQHNIEHHITQYRWCRDS
jgi:hypothetical protein